MTAAQDMAEALARDLPRIKHAGSLRIFGVWFGRPYDNLHRIVSCAVEGEVLRITFEAGEQLSLWSPRGLQADEKRFLIAEAARVRWEWIVRRQPRPEGQRGTMEFRNEAGVISLSADPAGRALGQRPSAALPAVELL